MGPRAIFVDGYNVIRNTPALADLERAGLAAGREALLARLAGRYRHTPHKVVVVFDGAGQAESAQPFPGLSRGRVIFTASGETADAVIIRLSAQARAEGCEVSVISDDGEVRAGAERQGATPTRVHDLQRRLGEAPRDLRKRFTHQQALRRILEEDDDEREARLENRRQGNGKRAPRKRDRPRWNPPI